jgi:hypothetical protein
VGDTFAARGELRVRLAEDSYVCVALPDVAGASRARPIYTVIDVAAQTPGRETTFPARAHLYAIAPTEMRLVGLERPATAEAPHP